MFHVAIEKVPLSPDRGDTVGSSIMPPLIDITVGYHAFTKRAVGPLFTRGMRRGNGEVRVGIALVRGCV